MRNCRTWGYFVPHVHLANDVQEIKYGKQPQNFKARLYLGVDYHVRQPALPKQYFLELVHHQIYVQRDRDPDVFLGEKGSRLRLEWLEELAFRARQQYVARAVASDSRTPSSFLMSDPQTIAPAAVLDSNSLDFELQRPVCQECQDINPLAGKKELMLV